MGIHHAPVSTPHLTLGIPGLSWLIQHMSLARCSLYHVCRCFGAGALSPRPAAGSLSPLPDPLAISARRPPATPPLRRPPVLSTSAGLRRPQLSVSHRHPQPFRRPPILAASGQRPQPFVGRHRSQPSVGRRRPQRSADLRAPVLSASAGRRRPQPHQASSSVRRRPP
jgi:hypothetical protein